jgi:beta-galactosidase
MKKLGATVRAQGENANSVIDGDPTTFWRAGDRTGVARDQIELQIDFPALVPMSGLIVVPRQNQREHEGDIKDYAIQVSDDGNEWRDVVRGELLSTFRPQRIAFAKTVTGRYLKLVVLTGLGTDKTTALAELAVIGPKPPAKKGRPN